MKWNGNHGSAKNFEEFQRVYGCILNKRDGEDKSSARKMLETDRVRPSTDLKTIRMEMPLLGSEQAIVKPIKRFMKTSSKKSSEKLGSKDESTVSITKDLVKKLAKLELSEKKSLDKIDRNPSNYLRETNKELDIASVQLEKIKSALRMEQHEKIQESKKSEEMEKPKKRKIPTHRSKKKSSIEKRYMTTLSLMQQKLLTLEEKYFNRPKIAYKSVNDTFTQSTEVETIFEKSFKNEKTDKTLDTIANGLDDIINTDGKEKYRNNEPRDLSFYNNFKMAPDMNHDCKQTIANDSKRISIKDFSDSSTEEICRKRSYDGITSIGVNDGIVVEKHPFILKDPSDTNVCQNKEMEKYSFGISNQKICPPLSNGDFHENKRQSRISEYHKSETRRSEHDLPKQLSFKKRSSPGRRKDSLAALIDASESQMRKFRALKQDIIDVESFCDKICNLTKDDDQNNQQAKRTIPGENDERIFDSKSQFQQSVLKSCYLMRESNVKPKINYFYENDSFIPKINKLTESTATEISPKNIKTLIRGLNNVLENTIYQIDTE
ncbi:hypothetical protein JTB14_029143 [Gonioctena quinquepunctata]|nr:hypothetical protein JTB14_029143 [Gonioctena quinquepunctata]